ncbi:MAG: DUF885 family protein [Alphaproteobacteria bacterium]|nr:DUF885 family protein [Alphaproteobacteria bacterium]
MRKLLLAAMTASSLMAADAAAGDTENTAFDKIVSDYEAYLRREDPIAAGFEGDQDALARLPLVKPADDARRLAALNAFKSRVDAIPAASLDDKRGFDRDFLAYLLAIKVEREAYDEGRIPFQNDSGFHTTMDYVARTTQLRSMADAEAYMARLSALPQYLEDNIANARRGIETGWVQPKIVADRVLEMARAQLAIAPKDDVLLLPFASAPASLDKAGVEALRAQAELLVTEQIRPRQQAFVTFLETEYLPKVRASIAVKDMPGGADWYKFQVRLHTTTDLTPDEIHEIGLQEVARIRGRMDEVMKETGFTGTFAEFLTFLRTDARFYTTTREDLLEKASEISKRIDDKLPAYFGTLPRLPYGVRPVPRDQEEGYTTGRYFPGSPDLGVAGGYMVNTSKLDQRGLYELPALTLHEAVPGHHLQIALQQELKNLAYFRRNSDFTAFVEGWGLYGEYLGEEMGIYRDAYERFGRLSYEMWRACRLVADTGMHWKGWDIEQARACFTDNSALSAHNIQTELERYISWPGQALAYKIGEMKLKELRARATTALGPRFDLRKFHDAVLLEGPMPLAMLESRIDAWIAAQKP